jgi:hypothetical protein
MGAGILEGQLPCGSAEANVESQLDLLAQLRARIHTALTEGDDEDSSHLSQLEELIGQHGSALAQLLMTLDRSNTAFSGLQPQLQSARREMNLLAEVLQARLRLTAVQLRRSGEFRRALWSYAQPAKNVEQRAETDTLIA